MNLIWLSFVVLNYFYLERNGENLTVAEIVKLQNIDSTVLYGAGTKNNTIPYKLELVKQKKPKIIAFGQSRVMQFREYFFSQPFVNMGGAWSWDMGLTKKIAQEVIKEHQPEVVIISLDYWLFGSMQNKVTSNQPRLKENKFDLSQMIKPWIWLKEHKISLTGYFQDLFNLNQDIKGIGVKARYQDTGFAGDGSYYYNNTVYGHEPSDDWQYQSTLFYVKNRKEYFEVPAEMHHENFESYMEVVNVFRSHGVKVILFMPPIAPTVHKNLMQDEAYPNYYRAMESEFNKNNINYVNYFDPISVTSDDCEYIDGLHPGDTVYAKILLNLASMPEYSYLNAYIDIPLLEKVVATYQHLAFIPTALDNNETETDFLGMECQKIKQVPLAQLLAQKVS